MLKAPNPIMARELKERMRTFRAPVVLTIYLLVLGLIVFGVERTVDSALRFEGALGGAAAGRTVFHWLLFFLLMFVCFMVPAFTATTISSERERQTFHLVQVTLMRPWQIVLGKLGAAFSWLGILVVATIPLVAVSFTLGGVTPLDVVRGYAMVLLTGLVIAMMGIAVSSRVRRAMGATVLSFFLVFALTVGTPIAHAFVEFWQSRDRFGNFVETRNPTWTLVLNPFVATASAIKGDDTGGRSATPFEGLFSYLEGSDRPIPEAAARDLDFEGPNPVLAGEPRDRLVPVWAWSVWWYLCLLAFSFWVAVRGVTAPTHVFRTGRRRKRGVVAG